MSSDNSNTVIFSDEDCDGMCATRIIHNGLTNAYPNSTHTIIWQTWDVFGLLRENVEAIRAMKPRTAYILDIGSDLLAVNYAAELLSEGINVVILDNHPPDSRIENGEDYTDYKTTLFTLRQKFPMPPVAAEKPYFFYESTNDNCTTGIAFSYALRQGWSVKNMEKWALLGLEGDVATETPEGRIIFDNLMTKHPHLDGLLASKNIRSTYDWSILAFYAQLLHNPRRMLFNDAPPVVYPAMQDMETYPNWLDFYDYVNKEGKGLTFPHLDKPHPAIKTILDLTIAYRKGKGEPEERGNSTQLDYPDFGVSIIRHKWNLGSALCNKLSSTYKKTWFVINDIPEYGVHVSGRGGADGKLHIGKVFRSCNPEIMEGGGLAPAGSAKTKTNNIEVILDELVRAVAVSKQ